MLCYQKFQFSKQEVKWYSLLKINGIQDLGMDFGKIIASISGEGELLDLKLGSLIVTNGAIVGKSQTITGDLTDQGQII